MPALYGNRDPVIIAEHLNHLEGTFDRVEVKQIGAGHFVQEGPPSWWPDLWLTS